jgi:hypothetical protein
MTISDRPSNFMIPFLVFVSMGPDIIVKLFVTGSIFPSGSSSLGGSSSFSKLAMTD